MCVCVCVSYRCGPSHRLEDEDVVQIVKKKVQTGEDSKAALKKPDRIADREKKKPLKS